MKILKTFSLLALMLLLIAACENNQKNTENEMERQEDVNPDEVATRWGEAWSSNKIDSVRNMMADDAVLLLNGREIPQDSMEGWLERSTAGMQNLESNSLIQGGQGNVAWDSGTFSHDFANDSIAYQGTYTFIWERSDNQNNDWKVKVMNIAADMQSDTLTNNNNNNNNNP